MSFDVVRVDLPLSDTQHSLKVWNHVDESNDDPLLQPLLDRNGMRLGVSDQDAWPALRAIFTANGGRSTEVQEGAEDGQPLMIRLGTVADGDAYFLHRRSGSLSGGTFNAGERFLRVDYSMSESDPTQVVLRMTPETRNDQREKKLVSQGGEIQTIEVQPGTVFNELAATVTLDPGEFVVIGSSAKAVPGLRIGSWWFHSQVGVEKYETLLCISPQPFRVQ